MDMGTRTNPIHVMAWQRSLAEIKAHGTHIRMMGGACPHYTDVDVDALIAERGPQAHLWDSRSPCPVCGKEQHYAASAGSGTPFRPMVRQEGRELWGL